ncbi:MAG: leucine-rich repeat domain-containing protein [Muribaculaceae bacterium]|nr:leucine-rich repeat domain-containing protein [Muribaculaceae bacterium]
MPDIDIAPYFQTNHLSFRYVDDDAKELMVVDLCYEEGWNSRYYSGDILIIPEEIVIDGITKPIVGLHKDCFVNSIYNKLTIPSSIHFIGNGAFYNCQISEIEFSEGLRQITNNSFNHCSGISDFNLPNSLSMIGNKNFSYGTINSVKFGNGLVSIGDSNFNSCNNLKEVVLPNKLNYLGIGNFNSCTNLKRVVIPKYLYFDDCFNDCPGIEEIIVGNTRPFALLNSFNKVDKSRCRLIVPSGSEETYMNTPGWKEFTNIVSDATVGVEAIQHPEVTGEENIEEQYFDISGMPISDPSAANGIVIKKKGTKAEKQIVR